MRFFVRFGQHALQHLREVLHPFRRPLRREDVEHRRRRRHLHLDFARLELSVAQQLTQLLARALIAFGGRVGALLGDRAAARDDEHA